VTLYTALAVVALLAAIVVGRLSGAVVLSRRMAPALIALAGAAVVMPHWLSGSGLGDIRIPVMAPFIIAGSTRWAGSRIARSVFAGIAALLLAGRVIEQSVSWSAYQAAVDEFRTASHTIAPGARVIVGLARRTATEEHPAALPLTEGYSAATFEQLAALTAMDRQRIRAVPVLPLAARCCGAVECPACGGCRRRSTGFMAALRRPSRECRCCGVRVRRRIPIYDRLAAPIRLFDRVRRRSEFARIVAGSGPTQRRHVLSYLSDRSILRSRS